MITKTQQIEFWQAFIKTGNTSIKILRQRILVHKEGIEKAKSQLKSLGVIIKPKLKRKTKDEKPKNRITNTHSPLGRAGRMQERGRS